jgi:aerobic-type carbon monoxide dehydrogenase small subunit (CoxS/CutS family)
LKIELRTTVNGRETAAAVKPNQTLLEWLRDDLHLKGSVEGCGVGVCGSCTVLVDGRPVREEEVRDYLSGNICRCGTYKDVLAAVKGLAEKEP